MIERLWNAIARIASVWLFLALIVIYVVCSQGFNHFRDQYAPARGFDARGFYKPSSAPAILTRFGSQLGVYLRQESTLDLAFPIVYSLLYAVGIVWLGKKTAAPRWLIVLPFAAALFDYCENFAVINMILRYRRTQKVPAALEWMASIATPVKTVLFIGSAAVVVVLAVIRVARAVQRWRKSEGEEEAPP
jgi:hypothetical protein